MTPYEEYWAMVENLTATQERCTQLLEEMRIARRERDEALVTASIATRLVMSATIECANLCEELAMLKKMLQTKGQVS